MAKSEESELESKLTRREFLGTSLKVGLGAVGVAVAGVGCGPGATPQAAPATPTPQPAAPTPTAVPKEPVVLEFWSMSQGPKYAEGWREAIKGFEDTHPSIKVNYVEEPVLDLRTKLQTILVDGGPGPDIIEEGGVQTFTYNKMPYGLLDVTDRVEAAGIKDNTPETPWLFLEEEGRAYGIPWAAYVYLLHYNKDLYEAAGIAGPPETWEDLSETINKIYDPSKETFGFITVTGRFISWILETLWYDSGVGWFEGSEDFRQYDITKPITINKPEAVAALEFLRSLAETAPGGILGNMGIGSGDQDAAFARGNLSHFFSHSYHSVVINDLNSEMVPQKSFDVTVFPKGPKRRGAGFGGSVIGITGLSTDPDAAWEFIKFASDNWEGRLAPILGGIPFRMDTEVDEEAKGGWIIPTGRDALAGDTYLQAFFPQLDALRVPLGENVEAYFSDQKTAQQALDDAAAAAAATLAG